MTECNTQIMFKGGMTEKTYRKWKKYIMVQISRMDRVSGYIYIFNIFITLMLGETRQ